MHIPIKNAWQLNERHYGSLTGLDKQETVDKHGKDQVLQYKLPLTIVNTWYSFSTYTRTIVLIVLCALFTLTMTQIEKREDG